MEQCCNGYAHNASVNRSVGDHNARASVKRLAFFPGMWYTRQMNEQYVTRIKYPRTYHFPWTGSAAADDKITADVSCMENRTIVVTEKMDGENTTMARDYIHARSVDSRHHESRAWVKAFWAGIRYNIPDGWRICGENMYAQHTIPYNDLPSYFLGFSIWDNANRCLSWGDTIIWFDRLGVENVPVLYQGTYDEKVLHDLTLPENLKETEGYVARVYMGFQFSEFEREVRKYVRKDHVQTDEHWMFRPVIPNGLKK